MGTLHVVATPIGNLDDVTLRALDVLGRADLVLAEDTRRTRILLDRHQVRARPVSLHRHNEASRIAETLEALRSGGTVALVSDAGTPLVSDPGERLVAAALDDGHRVEPIPGASAVLAALSVCGFDAVPFTFLGFPPRRVGAIRRLIAPYRARPETLILFESPRRIRETIATLAEELGDRRACLARELTKIHEEVLRAPLPALADLLAEEPRGEITLVIEGASQEEALAASRPSSEEVDVRIRGRLASGERARDIAAALAAETGLPRRDLYARVIALRGAS